MYEKTLSELSMSPIAEDTIEYFDGDLGRYAFDALLTTEKGWARIDANDDAPWSGMWCNPFTCSLVSFRHSSVKIEHTGGPTAFANRINELAELHKSNGCSFSVSIGLSEKLCNTLGRMGLSGAHFMNADLPPAPTKTEKFDRVLHTSVSILSLSPSDENEPYIVDVVDDAGELHATACSMRVDGAVLTAIGVEAPVVGNRCKWCRSEIADQVASELAFKYLG